jgi:hypothetical protein
VRKIAEKFEISKSQVQRIVTYQQRATYPVGWRRVRLLSGTTRKTVRQAAND